MRGGHRRGVNHIPVADRRAWHVCCCATDQHRFDCAAVEPHKRSGGPFLPLGKAAP